MPWLSSRASSPTQSPPGSPPEPRKASVARSGDRHLTYIPPLIDGACGTVLRAEQQTTALFWEDAGAMLRMMPALFQSMWTELQCNWKRLSWADTGDMAVHATLAVLELAMIGYVVPLWLILPGFAFALWAGFCMTVIVCLAKLVNGRNRVIRCAAGSDGWMMGQEAEDERWIYVGGMELSARYLSNHTLPPLSKLFSRSFTAIPTPTYGLPIDLLTLLLQRNTSLSGETTRILHTQLRMALLDPAINRVVLLSHNLGSVHVSKATAQLFCDLPTDKLSKLEIYTFGAASCEFILPTGETKDMPSSPAHLPPAMDFRPTAPPHIEHFAMTSDPLAQLGVLRAARENLETRFCGGVFVISSTSATPTAPSSPSPPTGLTLHSYLTALFPTQLTSGLLNTSILDTVMTIDRDVAEKREFAAMSNFAAARAERGGKKERLSWTALGATAGQKKAHGVVGGVAGLEMARKGCRDCNGHRGREVSWLVKYVNVGCVEAAGMNGMNGTNGMSGLSGMNGTNGMSGMSGMNGLKHGGGMNGIME